MSANSGQLNRNEDSEVMVRQVNLAAAFHDHISCTKISQHSIGTGICGLQTAVSDIGEPPNPTIGSITPELSTPFESDHIYATESKPFNDNSLSSNGCIRPNLFGNSLSDERNQIAKLTEMILGQLDLIQHQQEQLLKKDRQLQGLKQDREALCLRLEKMEKRIAVLTAKVANNNNNANVINNNTTNSISTNSLNNNTINLNRNIVNNNQSNNTIETDCEHSVSGSDTIVEESNSVVGLFTDPTVFTKLYSHSSGVNSSANSSVNNTLSSKNKSIDTSSVNNDNNNNENKEDINSNNTTAVKIKSEPIEEIEVVTKTTTTTTTSSTLSRKSRKRHSEVSASTSSTSVSTPNRKRSKASISCDNTTNEIKKEIINPKETSCDSLSTLSTTNNSINKILTNVKKKVVKQKSETCSRQETTQTTSGSSNFRNISLIKDVLLTSKPYAIVVNNSQLAPEVSLNVCEDESVDNKTVIEDKTTSDVIDVTEMIEVPKFRLHPVSSCYSLEGTENLDDEVFNRRHMKLENDERRRKRWDIQRLREHRYNEKLRTGRYYNSSLNNCFIEKPSDLKKKEKGLDFKSFYPEIKNVQAIEVAEKIPYIAFGHPVPKMPTKFFSLPWNTSERTANTTKDRKSAQKKN